MTTPNTEHFHSDSSMALKVLVDGCEDMAISFVGRDDYETVTCYAINEDDPTQLKPLFECDVEHFELLLEQASGAKMNAEGDYPSFEELP